MDAASALRSGCTSAVVFWIGETVTVTRLATGKTGSKPQKFNSSQRHPFPSWTWLRLRPHLASPGPWHSAAARLQLAFVRNLYQKRDRRDVMRDFRPAKQETPAHRAYAGKAYYCYSDPSSPKHPTVAPRTRAAPTVL